MAFNSAHWTINYTAKTVTNTDSGTGARLPSATQDQSGVGAVLAFFQWLATTFASSAQMDDTYPIESQTPTVFKWLNGWDFGHTDDSKYLSGGSIESSNGQELWANTYSIGTQALGTQIFIIQNDTEVPVFWAEGQIDLLLKVKTGNTLIDNGNLLVKAAEYGDFYDWNIVDCSGGGRNPVGINTKADPNNTTAAATVGDYGVTVTFGTISRDLNNGNGATDYDCEVDCNLKTLKEVYEFLKWRCMHNATGGTLNGDSADEYISANGSYDPEKVSPFGTLAGEVMYGARGIWFTNYAVADFVLINAAGVVQSPPNYQKVNANHDSLSGFNILVAEISGGSIIKNQYTINSVSSNSVTMTTSINPNKAPQSGFVKIGDIKYAYTGFSGAVLSGVTPDPTGETGSAYIPLMDCLANAVTELSDNIIYTGDIDVRTIVRQYGYKTYDVDTVFGSSGLSFSPILNADPQAT